MRTLIAVITILAAIGITTILPGPGSASACAGLIGSNGAVNLGRTTTLAGYHDGVEHYVTAFKFLGGGGQFGTLIPLPGVPSSVERGGDWTLQRLQRETTPVFETADGDFAALAQGAPRVEVLQEVKIDALDIKVLQGGGADVAVWAGEHGFSLSPDAPEVLDFYAQRSPIFLAAVFDGDAAAARGQQLGDGTPVHITIPTDNPWVPLRILGLGKQPSDQVQADVFLLTDDKPALLPVGLPGLTLTHDDAATVSLLDDLRADAGGSWVPQSAWLTKLQIDAPAGNLRYDLAIDASGAGHPSRVAAGLDLLSNVPNITPASGSSSWPTAWLWLVAVAALAATVAAARRFRRSA
jgi:hypothetical protein